jgi:hypothetical protein
MSGKQSEPLFVLARPCAEPCAESHASALTLEAGE